MAPFATHQQGNRGSLDTLLDQPADSWIRADLENASCQTLCQWHVREFLGPWALQPGPIALVITNWAFGKLLLSIPIKEMVPPSRICMAGLPRWVLEAF